MTWYTMIAYKEDGVDYCRGCVMDRWSGEHDACYTEDLEELKRAYASLALRKYDDREPRFEFTFLINGEPVYIDCIDSEDSPELIGLRAALFEAADEEIELQKQREIARKAREKEESRLREIREAEYKEKQERATLAQLQSKYGEVK